ncbi:MAG: 4-hydroxythreonine-4-phosphate dehydrogenase PdxA [Desulfovibrio sp.]
MNKVLCVTLGDSGGLGPELVCRVFGKSTPTLPVLMIGQDEALKISAEREKIPPFYTVLTSPEEIIGKEAGWYLYEPEALQGVPVRIGKECAEGGKAAGESLEVAVDLLNRKVVHGLLTCPLHKAMLQEAGFDFPGHTEFLAERLGVGRDNVCMHLGGPVLKVSLVTTHPALKDVAGMITEERILHCLDLTEKYVKTLGLDGPIAVCGLNPHAGESGKIGHEEIDTIIPALEKAKAKGINLEGPIPADTLFHFAAKGKYSAVLAMYHDQGLGPLKLLHFSEAVNVTLGLPMPRTSPDHGTGYDIVGTGQASTASFEYAYSTILQMIGE